MMAKTPSKLIFILFTIFFSQSIPATSKSESFYKTLSPSNHGLKKETLIHLHFYFQENASIVNGTAVEVTTPKSDTNFGLVVVTDSKLTVRPETSSKQVGRAQGFVAFASLTDRAILMVYNFVLTEGKYNGSSLSLLGRNPYATELVREMAIVGGTGIFRFARGYAQTSTVSFNLTARKSVFEYNLYVLHY